ncbi:hypothetical protein CSB37_03050 [bacterium DOLZORAL124_38_8]|nr:MAG: hypothetical protein CSB37_03050 [bacterium DOLZORAL124_38_8]
MKILLSPAKSLQLQFPLDRKDKTTSPLFLKQTKTLVNILQKKSASELQTLFSVSQNIAELNFNRYQNFPLELTEENSFPALDCFDGAVYRPIQTNHFTEADWNFAQKHLCILSGLYGILRPLDLLFPYRLEMGTKLHNTAGKNLYEFWSNTVTQYLNQTADCIINLASKEYFSVIDRQELRIPMIHIHFKEKRGDDYKVVAIYAKKARGAFAHEIIKQKISTQTELKNISVLGYQHQPTMSDETNLVFTRDTK